MAERFNIETVFRAVDRITQPVRRMQNSVVRATESMERGFAGAAEAVSSLNSGLASIGTKAAGIAATGAAVAGFTSEIAKADAETKLLAENIGISVERLEAMTAAVAPLGLTRDNIVDIIDEANKKFGELQTLGEMTTLEEAAQAGGIDLEKILKLPDAQQGQAFVDQLLQIEDVNKRIFAADSALGGEGSKIIERLAATGSSLEAIAKPFQELSSRSDESREGAVKLAEAMNRLTFSVSSLFKEAAGLAGGALSDTINDLTDSIKNLDREVLRAKFGEFLEQVKSGISFLIDNRENIFKWVKIIAVGIGVLTTLSLVLNTLVGVMTLVNVVLAANPITLIVAGVAAFTAAIIWAVTNIETFREKFEELPVWAKVALSPFQLLVETINAIINALKRLFQIATENNFNPFATLKQAIDEIIPSMETVESVMERIVNFHKDLVSGALDLVGLGGDDETAAAVEGRVIPPEERTARIIEQRRQTNESVLVIKDETGRAIPQDGDLGPGITMLPTGAF